MGASDAEKTPFAWPTLLALIASLAFMQPTVPWLGFQVVATDFLYLAVLAAGTVDVAQRRVQLTWHRGYWVLVFYLGAMLASAAAAGMPRQAIAKLATQVYLLSLPVLVCCLVRSERRLRQAMLVWIAGSGLVSLVGVLSLVVFVVDPHNLLLASTSYGFGSLPPGGYPRLQLTFVNANMLCNYLTVCLEIVLLAGWKGWIARVPFLLLLAGVLISALFTISPGLGGIALVLGAWGWFMLEGHRPVAARLSLAIGVVVAVAFVLAAATTPFGRPGDRVLFTVPGTGIEVAPAVRSYIWADALDTIAADPLFGRGIGSDPVLVHYQVPSGESQTLVDAHNVFLSVGAQCGLIGLAALAALLAFVWRQGLSRRACTNLVPVGLGFAFFNAFAYQGLTGSFEDARHLWVLFGLLLASLELPPTNTPPSSDERHASRPFDDLVAHRGCEDIVLAEGQLVPHPLPVEPRLVGVVR
jgi:O-antigen ligase